MSHPSITRTECDAHDGSCHVCGDVAIAGRIVSIDSASRTALVTLGADEVTVALDLVDAGPGDDVLVHLGFAIERLERA